MLVNLSATILDYDNKPVSEKDADEETPITYRRLIFDALNLSATAGAVWDGDSRMRCFEICSKIAGKDDVELDEKDRTFIVERAKLILFPLYLGRLAERLADPTQDDS